jgi:hypothetical protein
MKSSCGVRGVVVVALALLLPTVGTVPDASARVQAKGYGLRSVRVLADGTILIHSYQAGSCGGESGRFGVRPGTPGAGHMLSLAISARALNTVTNMTCKGAFTAGGYSNNEITEFLLE